MVRFADHLFATGRCVLIKPVARRPSSTPSTSLWASDDMGWLRDPPRGLQEKEEAARAREARRTRVRCAPNAATVRTTSAMAESVRDSTLDARSGCALCAVAPCARAVCEGCLGGVHIFDRRRANGMSGSESLPRDSGCVWCESQLQPWPLKGMVSVAVATSCGDPCGKVSGGDFGDLSSSPENLSGHNRHCFEVYIPPAKCL